ncbi:MAG: hypothetical protein H7Y17_07340, partial [Chlorobia bacterium]|nr:hypothetical protein [Fimbriimonadaceae bacterium]
MLRRNLDEGWAIVLTALYLPGAVHGLHLDRKRWLAVVGAMRSQRASLESAEFVLRGTGLFAEAAALSGSGALAWAERLFEIGRVMTCLDDAYPERWLSVLKEQAPPVLWRKLG